MRNKIVDLAITENSPTEPVTRAEVKKHCIVDEDSTVDDDLFDDLIIQCRKRLENYCNISIVEKNIVLISDWTREQQLPMPPIKAINDIKVKTGVATGGGAEYETPNTYSTDGGLFDMSGCYRLKITYTTGMTTVPEDLKLALLNEIAYRYENRGDQSGGVSDGALKLVQPYIDYEWS